MTKERWYVVISGVVIGLSALILVEFGNPKDMGFCIACFLRDIAGSLHLHQSIFNDELNRQATFCIGNGLAVSIKAVQQFQLCLEISKSR